MESPGFSKFRHLMDIWDNYLLEQNNENIIKTLIDQNGLIMFFQKDKDYFGAGESGRIVFAKIKNEDDDMPDGWEDEATFTACNLTKAVDGEASEHIFTKNDIKKLKIVDQEEVIKNLKNKASEAGKKLTAIKILPSDEPKQDRDKAPNFKRTDEE